MDLGPMIGSAAAIVPAVTQAVVDGLSPGSTGVAAQLPRPGKSGTRFGQRW